MCKLYPTRLLNQRLCSCLCGEVDANNSGLLTSHWSAMVVKRSCSEAYLRAARRNCCLPGQQKRTCRPDRPPLV